MTSAPAIDRYQALLELLDRPPTDNPGLQRLFSTPSPYLPMVIPDRMAVCREYHGRGIAKGMLKDAKKLLA